MKVLFICNNAFNPGNGLSVSALTTVKNLKSHGVDARLMAVRNDDPQGQQPDFPLEHFIFPVFEPIIKANGFCYAKVDKKRIREAIQWADVVQFEEALFLETAAVKIARSMGKACVATFHLYPHNIMANLGFSKRSFVNDILMHNWNTMLLDKCSDIQCPTEEVRRYLEAKGTKARLHVISNGLKIEGEARANTPGLDASYYDIRCVGRLAREKSQDTLLDAMRHSKYAGKIRLHFAGNGPMAARYRKMADKLVKDGVLSVAPDFNFYSREELKALSRKAYLYVHCAWVEVEGLSCLEAIKEGAVPVIAEGELIGTPQFSLTERSLYPVFDSKALAGRIDWWIEHPEERDRYSLLYAQSVSKYDVENSIESLIRMYKTALNA